MKDTVTTERDARGCQSHYNDRLMDRIKVAGRDDRHMIPNVGGLVGKGSNSSSILREGMLQSAAPERDRKHNP